METLADSSTNLFQMTFFVPLPVENERIKQGIPTKAVNEFFTCAGT